MKGLRVLLPLIVLVVMNLAHGGYVWAAASEGVAKEAQELFESGRKHSMDGRYGDAIRDFSKAIELDPDYAMAYINRGVAYHCDGRYNMAITDYKKAIDIGKDYVDFYLRKGNVFFDVGRYDQAIEDYTKAARLMPGYAAVYNNRGKAYESKGDYGKAIEDYAKAIDLDPGNPIAYINRGDTYKKKGNYEKAVEDYMKAMEINPQYGWLKDEMERMTVEERKSRRRLRYEAYIELYDSTRMAGSKCAYSLREEGGTGSVSIVDGLYISYGSDHGITGVKLPPEVSLALSQTASRNGYSPSTDIETAFFQWFSENILGAREAEEAVWGLCYLNNMAKMGGLNNIQVFIDGYLMSVTR